MICEKDGVGDDEFSGNEDGNDKDVEPLFIPKMSCEVSATFCSQKHVRKHKNCLNN